ncbi:hypothetical protein P7K49_023251 [Saguinus oedipus]|uniref:Uncharacterized protein n=1 Tax=Saguinus oedipus TaxID=9490 RepID=A0ABQ9ULV7_SAGOE|nr:hypothetical protein P7K49_023251 [Saguinus oedipus]
MPATIQLHRSSKHVVRAQKVIQSKTTTMLHCGSSKTWLANAIMSTSLTKLLPNLTKEAEFEGGARGENLGNNSTVAWQSSQYEKADIMWTFAVNFLCAKYGERFINGQKIREGGVKNKIRVFMTRCQGSRCRSHRDVAGFQSDPVRHLSTYLCLSLVVAQFVLSCLADQPHFFPEEPQQSNPCPEAGASLPSKAMFWLVWRGYRKPLRPKDLWSIGRENSSEELVSRLEKEWIKICSAARKHPKATAFEKKGASGLEAPETEPFLWQEGSQWGPLLRAIWQVFHSTFLLGTLSLVINDVFRFTVPKLLR